MNKISTEPTKYELITWLTLLRCLGEEAFFFFKQMSFFILEIQPPYLFSVAFHFSILFFYLILFYFFYKGSQVCFIFLLHSATWSRALGMHMVRMEEKRKKKERGREG